MTVPLKTTKTTTRFFDGCCFPVSVDSSFSGPAIIKLDIKNRKFSRTENSGHGREVGTCREGMKEKECVCACAYGCVCMDVCVCAWMCACVHGIETESLAVREEEGKWEKPWDFLRIRSNNFSRDLSGDLSLVLLSHRSLTHSLSHARTRTRSHSLASSSYWFYLLHRLTKTEMDEMEKN